MLVLSLSTLAGVRRGENEAGGEGGGGSGGEGVGWASLEEGAEGRGGGGSEGGGGELSVCMNVVV